MRTQAAFLGFCLTAIVATYACGGSPTTPSPTPTLPPPRQPGEFTLNVQTGPATLASVDPAPFALLTPPTRRLTAALVWREIYRETRGSSSGSLQSVIARVINPAGTTVLSRDMTQDPLFVSTTIPAGGAVQVDRQLKDELAALRFGQGYQLEVDTQIRDTLGNGTQLKSRGIVDSQSVACAQSASTACLLGDRFAADVRWRTSNNQTGLATVVKTVSGEATFSVSDRSTPDFKVEVINGCTASPPFFGFGVSASGLTLTGPAATIGVTITVHYVPARREWSYEHPPGKALPPILDMGAFTTVASACLN